ncbi:molybdate ABC transporter substrate-binding protein [soil metagenome]
MKGVALVAAALLLLAGCASPAPEPTPTASGDELIGTVTVFAAASLTESFESIKQVFAEQHPRVQVTFNFGGSSGLATQILEGAPVDVFVAASDATMKTVTDAAVNESVPIAFASNTLQIAVPAGNPGNVTELEDLADRKLIVALCAVEVPCGAASQTVFELAGVTPAPDTIEQDVKAVLTKVELGEVDAGLVYRTDVLAAGDAVAGIEFPEAADAVSTYSIVQLAGNKGADALIALLLSAEGRAILDAAGFGTP